MGTWLDVARPTRPPPNSFPGCAFEMTGTGVRSFVSAVHRIGKGACVTEAQAPQCSLVIPLYKSESCIPSLLTAVDRLSADGGGSLQVVFVDDGSPDGSYRELR